MPFQAVPVGQATAVLSVVNFINDVPNTSPFAVVVGPGTQTFTAGPDSLMFPTDTGSESAYIATLANIVDTLGVEMTDALAGLHT